MKVVINKCFGGFGLSARAMKRIAEIMGKELYCFKSDFKCYTPISLEEAEKELVPFYYTVPNPNDYKLSELDKDGLYKSANKRAKKISFPDFRDDVERSNQVLVQVVEELGKKASGRFAELEVIEIPDGIEFSIEEYDGIEHIAEKHQTWG